MPAVTVKVVDPLIDPSAAWMVVLPTLTPVASPPLLMVATPGLVELQVAEFVRSWWLPSLYVPVAANCCGDPTEIEGFTGVTAIETSVTPAVTVRWLTR